MADTPMGRHPLGIRTPPPPGSHPQQTATEADNSHPARMQYYVVVEIIHGLHSFTSLWAPLVLGHYTEVMLK